MRSLLSKPAALGFLIFAACGEESVIVPPVQLNTPDDVVESLRVAFETRSLTAYGEALPENFGYYFARNDVDFWGFLPMWSRAEELAFADAVFSGRPGFRPGGVFQLPVDTRFTFGLSFAAIEDDWTETPRQDAPFAGTLTRTFELTMLPIYTDTNLEILQGRQEFYLEKVSLTLPDGAPAEKWELRAWRDLGSPLPVARHPQPTMSFFKAMFGGLNAP